VTTAAGAPKSPRRRAAGYAAGILILAFLVFGVARSWDDVTSYDWQVTPLPLVGGVLLLAAFYVGSGLGYVVILEQLAARRLERRRLLGVWARSLLGRYVPGNVLMVAGRVVLGREAGVAGRVSLAASVYEQVLALAAGAVGGVLYFAFYGADGHGSLAWLVAFVPLGLVLLHPKVFRPAANWALAKARREPLAVFLSGRQVTLLFLLYAALALVLALGVGLVVHGLVAGAAGSVLSVGLGFLLAFVISMLAFVFPSGLGAREAVFAVVLARDLPDGVALSVAAGSRLVLTAVELVFVAAVAAIARGAGRRGWPHEGGLEESPGTGR
jgi:glycosyltransferase 2 family protein